MTRAREVVEDAGFEALGEIRLGSVVVIGDPLVIGRTPANGAYHALRAVPGAWAVFGRPTEDDVDRLEEIVLVAASELGRFFELYDEASVAAVLPAHAARIAVVDGPRKDDEALWKAMYEPDADALPWLVDDALVAEGDPAYEVVVRAVGQPAALVSVAFGPVPVSAPSSPLTEE